MGGWPFWVPQSLECQLRGLTGDSDLLVGSSLTSLAVTRGVGRTSSGASSEHGSQEGVRIAKVNVAGKRQKLHLSDPALEVTQLHVLSVTSESQHTHIKGKARRFGSSLVGYQRICGRV